MYIKQKNKIVVMSIRPENQNINITEIIIKILAWNRTLNPKSSLDPKYDLYHFLPFVYKFVSLKVISFLSFPFSFFIIASQNWLNSCLSVKCLPHSCFILKTTAIAHLYFMKQMQMQASVNQALYFINWPYFIVWLPLVQKILGNMCIVIIC